MSIEYGFANKELIEKSLAHQFLDAYTQNLIIGHEQPQGPGKVPGYKHSMAVQYLKVTKPGVKLRRVTSKSKKLTRAAKLVKL